MSRSQPCCCPEPSPLSLSYGSDQTYFEEIKQFYYRDEFSHQVQEWNRQRTMAIERSLNQFLYVQMAKELKNKLLVEAKEYVIKVRGAQELCQLRCLWPRRGWHLHLRLIDVRGGSVGSRLGRVSCQGIK